MSITFSLVPTEDGFNIVFFKNGVWLDVRSNDTVQDPHNYDEAKELAEKLLAKYEDMTKVNELTVTKLHEFNEGFGEVGHFYCVSVGDSKNSEIFMEWDNVASGNSPDSHVLSNQSDLALAIGSYSHEVLAAIRKAF